MSKQRQPAIVLGLLAVLAWGSSRIADGEPRVIATGERAQMDPITGLRWRWTRDTERPEAPPRLTLMRGAEGTSEDKQATSAKCVRSGDRMQLRMRGTDAAAMTIEATALAAGGRGDRVPARVLITGARVQITILGRGEGMLEARDEAWR